MSVLDIDLAAAEAAVNRLDAIARGTENPPAHRYLPTHSSLAAAITTLEHRLAAVDGTLGTQIVLDAIELRSAAEEARRADR